MNTVDQAFGYISLEGIEAEKDYPYTAAVGACQHNYSKNAAEEKTFVDVAGAGNVNETMLMMAIAAIGPIAVQVDATQQSFQLYAGGIYNEPNCQATGTHGMLAVGYGICCRKPLDKT